MVRNSFFILILGLSSCQFFDREEANQTLVAQVGDSQLYEEDFSDIFNAAQNPEDSIKLREQYISNWVKEAVLFNHSLKNLTDSQKNKEEQLNQYYRSLIRYEYEKGLIAQNLDTNISRSEIAEYYRNFSQSFLLKRRALQMQFLTLSLDVPKLEVATDWLKEETVENQDSLHKYALMYASKFNLDPEKWFYADELLPQLGFENSYILPDSGVAELYIDSAKAIIFKVHNSLKPGDAKPLKMASSTIRSIIKNKKKVNYISKMEKDVLLDAERKNLIEIYN